jgi:hypothetical protein
MTAPRDQFGNIVNQSQDAVTSAINTWASTVQTFAGKAGQAQLPGLPGVVDHYFAFAETVLANQRQLAHQWVSAAAQASGSATEQAQRATRTVSARTVDATEAVVDNATETARVAGDTTAVTTRAVTDLDG